MLRYPSDDLLHAVIEQLSNLLKTDSHLYIAFSGGLDSTCLLHMVSKYVKLHPSHQLTAIYIDHGLQADSSAWMDHCRKQADSLNVAFISRRVEVSREKKGLESAAREARWAAFRDILSNNQSAVLLLGHHADDQVETLLLRLLRGSGVSGLASMSNTSTHAGISVCRPFLFIQKKQLFDWAKSKSLTFVTDSSNSDNQFDRNYLRNIVIPKITERWPTAACSVGKTIQNLQSDWHHLIAYAEQVMQPLLKCRFGVLYIDRQGFNVLSHEIKKLILRVYLLKQGWYVPSSKRLSNFIEQILTCKKGSQCELSTDEYRILLYADEVFIFPSGWFSVSPDHFVVTPSISKYDVFVPNLIHFFIDWSSELIPGHGPYEVVFQRHCRSRNLTGRHLKYLFQKYRIPPFLRQCTPLLCANNRVIMPLDFSIT